MNTISYRATRVFGALVVLAVAALMGCAATGGAVMGTAATTSRAAVPVPHFAAPPGYLVCAGGHASRFEESEKAGRVCRPVLSLREIY